jgi:hypothetical protein
LQQNADALVKQANNNLNDTILPGIRSGAQAAGQYGSSRQGIAEGVAAGRNNEGIASALASLYGNAYNTDQSNDTARIGLANNYNLGLGNLNNQSIANNQSFYTAQRGQDLTQYGLGANLFQSGVQGNLGIGAGQYGLGQTYQNAPLTSLQQYSNTISPYSGLNSTQAAAPAGTSPALAGVGGALAGYQTYQNLYQGGGTNNVYNTGNSNLSYGGGSGYGGSTYGGYGSFGG